MNRQTLFESDCVVLTAQNEIESYLLRIFAETNEDCELGESSGNMTITIPFDFARYIIACNELDEEKEIMAIMKSGSDELNKVWNERWAIALELLYERRDEMRDIFGEELETFEFQFINL